MGTVLGLIGKAPTVGRVIEACLTVSQAWEATPRFIHVGTPDNPASRQLIDRVAQAAKGIARLEFIEGARIHEAVLAEISRNPPRLLVLGALPREDAFRDVIGSTARRLALRSPCSVLLVATNGATPSKWQRAVVGVDHTEAGTDLAEKVAAIIRQAGRGGICFAREEETFGHPPPQPSIFSWRHHELADMPPSVFPLANFAEGVDTGKLHVQAVLLPGRSGREIARFAADGRFDLLGILAPDRPLGLTSRLLSHPIRLVLDALPTSVLLHRPDGPSDQGETR